ncbi:OmpW family protein [Caenibius tardaugens NBRC 16725]|uniref:OmpW family protein n=1 Tax=Caenibius tardaugens NBRC 16725 TaxID=1219035 RepID=U2YMW6_9SPHN|nr:OmpW family outer membrane protein [Caenibius tardaugens]AZI37638.1 OmpW family protein [Caenibius tardaugens NBRC 16725]GAD49827.1 OmpW family protein [Caenibius tardaugens NBRC 16725]
MRKLAATAVLAAAVAFTAPAHAANPDGKIQIKVLGSAVLPDGKLDKVKFATPGIAAALPVDAATKANDNFVPTVAIEYFVTPSVSLETICCVTQHDVDGKKGLAGAELISNAKIIPATLTLKYHFNTGGIKPYVGAGPTLFIFVDEKSGATARALGAERNKLQDSLGLALQAGVDIPLNNKGMSLSLDAKRYFLKVDSKWYDTTGAKVLETRNKLDPWVLSAGLAWRF